jgi:glutaconate CoA-transferase, subunit A
MKISHHKILSLQEAVGRYVPDGALISVGGFTVNRAPMAAVYEIIRQKKRDLHLCVHSAGQSIDDLIGAGCVSRIELAYAGNGRFASTGVRFRKAVQADELLVEDYSNYQMTLRFMAGAMGLPFLPLKSTFETDIINKWGFSESMRRSDEKLPPRKLAVIDNPFEGWCNTKKLVAVPAINPDVTIIHAQKADEQGTVRIEGLTYADVEQAKASRHLIVTCEEIISMDHMRDTPDLNSLPHFCVDAVVHAPKGAFPTACFNYYDYDPQFLTRHEQLAKDDELYKTYLDEYIYRIRDHAAFIELIGVENFKRIQANPTSGYATGLNREV